ncbi:FtsB family cell division protein [Aurantiacibacter hainanensis]|uniref:FtsB family cell division protein n=1 Tax=Aurantiacibacter hainanensis TaxID=3076114 RepID=UPI0030C6D500
MKRPRRDIVRERIGNAAALLVLMLIGGLALIGPSGVLAWGEQASRLDEHEKRIAALQETRAELENRVELLDPENVDPDFASELVRGNLNVAHPDEYVVELEPIE